MLAKLPQVKIKAAFGRNTVRCALAAHATGAPQNKRLSTMVPERCWLLSSGTMCATSPPSSSHRSKTAPSSLASPETVLAARLPQVPPSSAP